MPRLARNVFPNIPHHVTQRGNRREDVFFTDDDRLIYLEWLEFYCKKYDVSVLAYCLMTNHVHLVLTPHTKEGLQQALKPLHMRYSQHINKTKGWSGHSWQGRFFSSPLDEAYTWSTIRYVEQNPVRAGMLEKAEDYRWSSAASHCGLKSSLLLADLPSSMRSILKDSWSEWLTVVESRSAVDVIQRNVEKGLPCGDGSFLGKLEIMAKKSLRYRPQGRPFKNKG